MVGMYVKAFGRLPCDFMVTWMFMRDVGEEMCWRQVYDFGDCFDNIGHQN